MEKNSKRRINSSKQTKRDFFLIDDNSKVNDTLIEATINAVNSFGYNVKIISLKMLGGKIINKLCEYQSFDTIITIGEGGKSFYNAISPFTGFEGINIYNVTWHRKWIGSNFLEFETDIYEYNLKDKNILLIEDVIASGESLNQINERIRISGGNVIGILNAIIIDSSPFLKDPFAKLISALSIKQVDKSKNPFWFPPIYSYRHIFYGDAEMSDIYAVMNKIYFNNSNLVEKTIKKYRE